MTKKLLLNKPAIEVTLNRLCCELIENHDDFRDTVIIGLQPRGVPFARRLVNLLQEKYKCKNLHFGTLDITFFRDDFRRRDEPVRASETDIDFLVEDKKVVFIDDVFYTGRSVRAALDAIHSFGRPAEIELLVLIERRFSRHLPIQPDYTGNQVDSIASEKVKVCWKEEQKEDAVYLLRPDENE